MISQAMIAAWILVAVALFALGILVYVAIRNRTRRVDLEAAVQTFRSLDIEAFRNLVDAAEEAFLRNNLPTRSSARSSGSAPGQHLSTPGKREGPRRRWQRLAKPRNGAPTRRSQHPAFRLPRVLFGFDCKPSGLASAC